MNRWVNSVGIFVVVVVACVVSLQAQERRAGPVSAAAGLPEGPGREAVTSTCGSCHGVNMVAGSAGYSQAGWRDLIGTMVTLPADREAAITQYLAAHFPPKPGRAPELVAGDVSVTFKEWVVPTLGQRSRDPLQTKDGTIWWNGQFISLIGRLNPATGEMREFKHDPAS
jgi:virginiamycin B lyase